MKQTFKILLLMLSLVLILGSSVISVFAADEAVADVPNEEKTVDLPVKETYYDEDGNTIHILEDGSKYNSTEKKWILEEKEGMAFETNFDRMIFSLRFMWQGMLCIFIVIAVIVFSVVVMNFFSDKAEARKTLQESEENN